MRGRMPSKIRELETRNVAAIIPGSDPKLKDEAVIYSAHWDHLGIGTPVNGDAIYNGAIDNATGCAILLELARVWGALPQKPQRSALFLAVTAEEGGLRGSEYYAAHPLIPVAKTAVALNFDALYPFGRGEGRGDYGGGADDGVPAGAADREAGEPRRSRRTRSRRRAIISGRTIFRSRTRGFRRFRSNMRRSLRESRRVAASRCTRRTTARTTMQPSDEFQ